MTESLHQHNPFGKDLDRVRIAVMPGGPMEPHGPYSKSHMAGLREAVRRNIRPHSRVEVRSFGLRYSKSSPGSESNLEVLSRYSGLLIDNTYPETWHRNRLVIGSLSAAAVHSAEYMANINGTVACTGVNPAATYLNSTRGDMAPPVRVKPTGELRDRLQRIAELPIKFLYGDRDFARVFLPGLEAQT